MGTKGDILILEEKLRLAELGPDPKFFEEHLADDVLIDGKKAKNHIVSAHRPSREPKFTKVEMSEMQLIDHGDSAVVMCTGTYEGPTWSGTMKFMRVWVKKNNRWQIIAGTTLP